MKKREIARNMARRAGIGQAEAADQLDVVVRRIVARLRNGQEADLPGLGRFIAGPDGRLCFKRAQKEPAE